MILRAWCQRHVWKRGHLFKQGLRQRKSLHDDICSLAKYVSEHDDMNHTVLSTLVMRVITLTSTYRSLDDYFRPRQLKRLLKKHHRQEDVTP